jgi:hypothetical protein
VLVSGPVWLGVAWGVRGMEACRCQMGLNTGREGMGGVKWRKVHT